MATPQCRQWVVHKFGGTSMGNAGAISQVARILEQEDFHQANGSVDSAAELLYGIAVVVSAMSSVTNDLIDVVQRAKNQDTSYIGKFDSIIERHYATIRELFAPKLPAAEPAMNDLINAIRSDARDVTDLLRAVYLSRTCSEAMLELISGMGEMWSSKMFSAYLKAVRGLSVTYLNAKDIVVVLPGELGPSVQWAIARARLADWFSADREHSHSEYLVIPGFVATTPEGLATTLKRNGSDFSGTIFGELLAASKVVIWTDVDGMFSADPRKVGSDARRLPHLSYHEALEMSYFGAKVLHPPSLAPCMASHTPLWIRNTFRPDCPGTLISEMRPNASADTPVPVVKGFSMIDGIALVNLEGTGMVGVPGVAQRLFGSLKDASVNVVLISQASSEHSICVAVHESQAERARAAVETAFFREITILGHIQHVDVVSGCAILAAVGDAMVDTRGVAARLFTALAWAGVNIRAIAQGSSERNISAVVAGSDAARALRAAHAAFFLPFPTVAVGVIGATGLVGAELMRQLARGGRKRLRERLGAELRIRGLARSEKMLLGENIEIEKGEFAETLQRAQPGDTTSDGAVATMEVDKFLAHVRADYLPYAIIIDCTTSDTIPQLYPAMVDRGCHVIAANKKGFAGDMALYMRISEQNVRKRKVFYETTVGAGLPVLKTVRELVDTGDRILRIEAVLSGTLSYIFNEFSQGSGSAVPAGDHTVRPLSFSEIVGSARAAGYTEPDPRDDLCGADFARKLVILAREAGAVLSMADIAVESLVPRGLEAAAGISVEEFMTRLGAAVDNEMAARRDAAARRGEVLRFVGTVEFGSGESAVATLSLRSVPAAHPLAALRGTENIVSITTERYCQQPMVIRGPGAGAAVTAAGIVGDLVALVSSLASPPGWVETAL